MKHARSIWRYTLEEPFSWIRDCIFQPSKFDREFGKETQAQRIKSMLRLILPMFLIFYPFGLVARAIFIALHLIPFSDISGFLLAPIIGIVLGIAGGIVFGIVLGIMFGIALGIAAGIVLGVTVGIAGFTAFGMAGGITFAIAFAIAGGTAGGIAYGITVGAAGDIAGGIAVGIAAGIALGLAGGLAGGIIGGMSYGLTVGLTGGLAGGLAGGIAGVIKYGITLDITVGVKVCFAYGIAGGIILGIAYGISVGIVFCIIFIVIELLFTYRLPLYPISGFSLVRTYFASKDNPPAVFTYLRNSALYWDERVNLPLPYLKHTLHLAAKENIELALVEITFIAAERPQQLRAAQAIASEIAVAELELRKSLSDIAGAEQQLDQIFPQDVRLINPRWITPFARLRDASQEAQRSLSPLGRQARYEALELMKTKLRQVHPNVAFSDQQLNRRLSTVVETWLTIAQEEQHKIEYAVQALGSIGNPYKPGVVLNTNDITFVGRRDLAQQLEAALSRSTGRRTFMLYGERRFGKSSTLMYLPKLLGSRYLPIFCDLQKTGVASNIAIFLGTLAEAIQRVMSARGMKAKPLSYETLKQALKENEAAVYHTFNQWFYQVEQLLESESRTILLTLDEFEQLADAKQSGGLQLPALLNWFRHTIQYHSCVALLFSGIHTLEEMESSTGVNWSSYFVNVRMLHVGFLQPEDAQQLVTYAGKEIFANGVVEMIIDATGCHPFLIQAVCSVLIDNLNAEKRERAEVDDVNMAMEQVLEEWSNYFRDLWRRTDKWQRACLMALKMLGKADINQLIQNDIDEHTLRQTLQMLVKRDLVKYDNDGMYRIAAPIFNMWLEMNC